MKVHTGGEKEDGTYEGGKVNYTGQLFFADDVAEEIFTLEPYARHTGGRRRLAALDADLHARAWSPRGSAGLFAGDLFLDALPVTAGSGT